MPIQIVETTADVVPKSEVDMFHHLLKDAWKRIEELNNLCGDLQKAKTDVAMEIFEEIEQVVGLFPIENQCAIVSLVEIAELKKKYTEGESNGSKQ